MPATLTSCAWLPTLLFSGACVLVTPCACTYPVPAMSVVWLDLCAVTNQMGWTYVAHYPEEQTIVKLTSFSCQRGIFLFLSLGLGGIPQFSWLKNFDT